LDWTQKGIASKIKREKEFLSPSFIDLQLTKSELFRISIEDKGAMLSKAKGDFREVGGYQIGIKAIKKGLE